MHWPSHEALMLTPSKPLDSLAQIDSKHVILNEIRSIIVFFHSLQPATLSRSHSSNVLVGELCDYVSLYSIKCNYLHASQVIKSLHDEPTKHFGCLEHPGK